MNETIQIRKRLHALAELSGKEIKTSQFIESILRNSGKSNVIRLDNNAIIATNGGEGGVLMRADMDALLIDESHLNINHASLNQGVSHKCGHDGHSAILIDFYLKQNRNERKDTWHLLFQHSEENGKGAMEVLHAGILSKIKPDFVFGMHNIPGVELGTVLIKKGIITSSVGTLHLIFSGESAHASEPWKGVSPLPVIAELLGIYFDGQHNSTKGQLTTLVFVKLGDESYGNGTSPGRAEIKLTIRSESEDGYENLCNFWIFNSGELARKHGLKLVTNLEDRFRSTENSDDAVELLMDAAVKAKLKIKLLEKPFSFGEDFGFYSPHYSCCFFGIGAGINHVALHHEDYDFPDELIETASKLWESLIQCYHDYSS